MYTQWIFFLVAVVVGTSASNIGRWSKREVAISEESSPVLHNEDVKLSPPNKESQDSDKTPITPEQEKEVDSTLKPKLSETDANDSADPLIKTMTRLKEAFKNYDQKPIGCFSELRLLADDIKYFKKAFDDCYKQHTQKTKGLEKILCKLPY